jgi:PKD repeat protein
MTLRTLLTTAALALAAVTPMSTWSAELAESGAQRLHPPKAAFPAVLPAQRHTQGAQAVQQLGQSLPDVAAWYGRSADEFRSHLLNDRSWRLDRRGRVFIVEEMDRPLPATAPLAAGATSGLLDGTLAPLDQTFLLHSKPGAARTIYLNFKGATLSGTAWNSSGTTINAQPFDLDGIPYTFSTAELQRIQYIWQRVAEDYAAFDVNVTTEAVAPELLARAGSTDTVYGTTVLITSSTGVYSCSCGGVAYLGVFDDTSEYYKPALVFYNQLGGGNEKYVAEAISHEAGHNMGLAHDGTATVGYYQGHGSGATGWAPIMGVGYYQALVQWSKGEYSGANNTQDDFAVMQSNGLPLRADDHGNTTASATVLSGSSAGGLSTLAAQGVIERAGDVDVFSFAAGAGSASFSVSPAVRSPNLDVIATLRDAAGTVLATANPADAVNAIFSATLPANGTYTLSVQGTGKGDPLGHRLQQLRQPGPVCGGGHRLHPGSLPPAAVISASAVRGTAPFTVAYSGAGSSDPDGSVVAWDWSFSEGGTASGATTSRTYTTPGTYTTALRVTDNAGLSASSSVTVTVDAPWWCCRCGWPTSPWPGGHRPQPHGQRHGHGEGGRRQPASRWRAWWSTAPGRAWSPALPGAPPTARAHAPSSRPTARRRAPSPSP